MQDTETKERVETAGANVTAHDRPLEAVPMVDGEEYEFSVVHNDFNVDTLCNFMLHEGITIPVFQRDYVWNKRKASRFIESVALGLPVPEIFVYEMGRNDWQVVDGQQRLLSLYYFSKGRFPGPKAGDGGFSPRGRRDKIALDPAVLEDKRLFSKFSMDLTPPYKGARGQLHGKTRDELAPFLRNRFDLRPIRTVVIRCHGPENYKGAVEVFERLNTGGENLSAQQIRDCVFQSPFLHMVAELNRNPTWRKMVGKTLAPKRRDAELVLRALAMLVKKDEKKDGYSPPASKFLDGFCAEMRDKKKDDEDIRLLHGLFDAFMRACEGAEDAFAPDGRFRIALFEAVFVASLIGRYRQRREPDGEPGGKFAERLRESVGRLAQDQQFAEASKGKMMGKQNVQSRLAAAGRIVSPL